MNLDFSGVMQQGQEELPEIEQERTYPILNVESAKQSFLPIIHGIDAMVIEMEALRVDNSEANEKATFIGASASKLLKKIEEVRKQKTEEPKAFVDSVNAFARMFTDKLKAVKELAARKTAQWQLFVEQERQKKEVAARKAAQELQEKLQREADEANRKAQEEARMKAEEEAKANGQDPLTVVVPEVQKIEAPVVVEPIIPKREAVTRTEAGSASVTQRWTFKIIDPSLIPRKYMLPSETAIRNAINGGVRDIPGVEIYQEAKSRFRT